MDSIMHKPKMPNPTREAYNRKNRDGTCAVSANIISYAITQPLVFYRIFSLVSPLLLQAPQQDLPSWQPSWPL